MNQVFTRYFTLEEAVGLLAETQRLLETARQAVRAATDDIVLYKRLLTSRKDEGGTPPGEPEIERLREKYAAFDTLLTQQMEPFVQQGIIVRDLEEGLIDFPYHSRETGEDYFLCWKKPEDGLFYFHPVHEGFSGRRPISLLPD